MSKQSPQKSRLGRGLSSLMNLSGGAVESAAAASGGEGTVVARATNASSPDAGPLPIGIRVVEASIDQITPNPHQPRRHFNETALKELANSLKTTGMIQPVVARATNEGGYELIAGERRWRAAKIAGLTALPVIVRSVDPVMQAQMALVENLQRQDLNPIERAAAYQTLLSNLGLTQNELADRLAEDRSVIAHHLRLLELPAAVQDMVADARLSMSHARILAGVTDPADQVRLANLVVSQDLNVKNLERAVNQPMAPPAGGSDAPKAPSAHLVDLEKSISRHLGMRVQVKASSNKKKGRLIVHYASLDQFDDLLSKLGVTPE